MREAREQPLRIVGVGDAAPPHRHALRHRAAGSARCFRAPDRRSMRSAACEPVPQRRLRQRLQQVDGQHRDLRHIDEVLEPAFGVVRVGVEAEDDAGGDLQPVAVERLDRTPASAAALFCSLRMALSASASGVSMPTNRLTKAASRISARISGLLGDVERRLAGELQRIAVLLLPSDEMRQHLARRPCDCR